MAITFSGEGQASFHPQVITCTYYCSYFTNGQLSHVLLYLASQRHYFVTKLCAPTSKWSLETMSPTTGTSRAISAPSPSGPGCLSCQKVNSGASSAAGEKWNKSQHFPFSSLTQVFRAVKVAKGPFTWGTSESVAHLPVLTPKMLPVLQLKSIIKSQLNCCISEMQATCFSCIRWIKGASLRCLLLFADPMVNWCLSIWPFKFFALCQIDLRLNTGTGKYVACWHFQGTLSTGKEQWKCKRQSEKWKATCYLEREREMN